MAVTTIAAASAASAASAAGMPVSAVSAVAAAAAHAASSTVSSPHSFAELFTAAFFVEHPTIVGSVIALIGTAVTGFLTYKGVKRSLLLTEKRINIDIELAEKKRLFDLQESSREREHALERDRREALNDMRRELYLDIVAKYFAAVAFVASLPTREFSEADYASVLGSFASAVVKTSLISRVETSLAASEAHAKVQEHFFRMMPLAIPCQSLSAIARRWREQHQYLVGELDGLTNSFRQATTEEQFAKSKAQAAFVSESLTNAGVELEKANRDLMLAIAGYQTKFHDGIGNIQPDLQKFLSLARTELGNEDDAAALACQAAEMFERSKAAVRQLWDAVGITA